MSFSNEGYLTRDELETMLGSLWHGTARVSVVERDYPRYVGARIGIYNPRGEKVGTVSHVRNREFVYVVTNDSRKTHPEVLAMADGDTAPVSVAIRAIQALASRADPLPP
mgnify:FL=1